MVDEKPQEKLPGYQYSPQEAADTAPIAEDLSDSDLEEVSGGVLADDTGTGGATKNTICGSNC